jgi:hypothetical protein
MKIDCAYDALVPIEKIVPNPRNNNRHSIEQIEELCKLIKAHGFRNALVVSNRSGFIVAGHGRLEAALKLGLTKLPIDYQDFESEAEEYQCLTADNEIARWSQLDKQSVHLALEEIPDLNLELLGIDKFNIEPIADFEMGEELREDMNKKFLLEIQFPNDMEMMDIHDDLTHRGYLVKIK